MQRMTKIIFHNIFVVILLFVFMLSGCGRRHHGNPPPVKRIVKPITGSVVLGAVAGATVFADHASGPEANHIMDADEAFSATVTSPSGTYSIAGPSYPYVIVSIGGTDTLTGQDAPQMLAPQGAANISLLTTMVAIDPTVRTVLEDTGISYDSDITTNLTPAAAILIQSIQATVTSLTSALTTTTALPASVVSAVQQEVLTQVTNQILNDTSAMTPAQIAVALTDSTALSSTMQSAVANALSSSTVTNIASFTNAGAVATSVHDAVVSIVNTITAASGTSTITILSETAIISPATASTIVSDTQTASTQAVASGIAVSVPPDLAPAITGKPETRAHAGLLYSFVPTASDPEGDNLQFSIVNKPSWASFSTATGKLSGTPAAGDVGITSGIIISVSDGAKTTSLPPFDLQVVAAVALSSIAVSADHLSTWVGHTVPFTATAYFADTTTQDITTSVVWSSSNTSVISISNDAFTTGLAAAKSTGTVVITATLLASGDSGTMTFSVLQVLLTSITIAPLTPSVAAGTTLQFTATGHYSDGSTQDLTQIAIWSSSAASVATISNVTGQSGKATTVAAGLTTITATVGTVFGSTILTVTSATLVSIAVTPSNPSMALGTTQYFTATGTFSFGPNQDLTASVDWSSSAPTVASINASGKATALTSGTTTITATFRGISGSTTLSVSNAVLVSLAVSPGVPSINAGLQVQFTATGTFSDSSTQDMTALVLWTSGTPTVASISNTAASIGLATGLSQGVTKITATLGKISASTDLTVTGPLLISITVTPANYRISRLVQGQYHATGHYSDSSTQDLTAFVFWSSSDTSVATITAAGWVVGVGGGNTTITATSASVSGSTNLYVFPTTGTTGSTGGGMF